MGKLRHRGCMTCLNLTELGSSRVGIWTQTTWLQGLGAQPPAFAQQGLPSPQAQSQHFLPELLHMVVLLSENLKLCDVNILISSQLEYILKYCNSLQLKKKSQQAFPGAQARGTMTYSDAISTACGTGEWVSPWAPQYASMLWKFSESMTSARFCCQALLL